MKIGNIELKNQVIAAPMAGITNLAYRKILHSMGASLVVAEMVSDKAIVYDNKRTIKMLKISQSEHPVAMQLFGSDIVSMVQAAKYLDTHCDCDIIDINLGCPVPKVVKTGAGSALLQDPNKAYEIVKAVVQTVNKPVTVKMRLGWDKEHINCVEVAKLMEKAGVSAIFVHARTRSEFYSSKAHYEYLKLIKEAVNIPVIGNGDITSAEIAKQMLTETGVDAVMIGRGLLGNPWLIKDCIHYLDTGEHLKAPTLRVRVMMCLRHAKALMKLYNNEEIAIKEMRTHTCYYIKGFPNASKYKKQINGISTYNDLELLLKKYIKEVKGVK